MLPTLTGQDSYDSDVVGSFPYSNIQLGEVLQKCEKVSPYAQESNLSGLKYCSKHHPEGNMMEARNRNLQGTSLNQHHVS